VADQFQPLNEISLTMPSIWLIYISSILCAGLDPANPLFNNVGPNGRLDAGDAILVDTIITDGDGLGLLAPIGLVNFYPNGGRRVQPGCGITDIFVGESVLTYTVL